MTRRAIVSQAAARMHPKIHRYLVKHARLFPVITEADLLGGYLPPSTSLSVAIARVADPHRQRQPGEDRQEHQ